MANPPSQEPPPPPPELPSTAPGDSVVAGDVNDQPVRLEAGGQSRCLGGRFDLLDRLGAGGGAVVVRARDRQLPRSVAVKLLCSRDADLRRRFVQESEVLARMDHPAIVRVFAHDRDGEDLYTVLELLEGLDLREHLVRSGPLPWRQVVDLGIQIAEALEEVHRHGLVHRDVKPENLVLTTATPMRVKLIDFGVVRITANYRAPTGAPARQPTDMGMALGTPGYLPLEAGLVAPNPSFDVFGLGATLYELLTGRRPEEPQRTLREMHPGCDAPEDLGHVLAAALALEPEDRTQTAAELGRALAAIRAAHPERGAPSSRIDGRYELIGLAGSGGKADAYLAVHRGAGHDVVLKFLRSPDPNDALRFVREAKLLETFNHPALPRFYDFAPEAKPPYIAMACAPGQPAVRLCSSSSRLRPPEVAAVGVKLAQVLALVHARGVLHRDINANNVLIDANGAVTLLDFGCAELSENFYNVPAGERRYLTPPETRVVIPSGGIGKLAWSAPEVRADTGWTEKSDVYSMGHLLFRLMTGKPPIKGADPPTSPLEHVVTCPEEIATAIQSALRVDPEARPTAAQFAQKLIDALESEEEEWARAVAAAKPAGRPPLRLVTAGDRADWTDHSLPESSGSFAAEALAREVSAASSATPKPAPTLAPTPSRRTASEWLRVGLEALAAATILVLALRDGDGHIAAEPSPAPQAEVVHVAAESSPTRPSSGVTQAAVVTSSLPAPSAPQLLASSEVPKPMREALADAASELRHCSELAGGPLIVQFTTAKEGDRFADVAIHSRTSPAVDRCVGDATTRLRFQPLAEPQRFTEEYP